jgi:2-polyprenyl-3-methyl-5-hydroxy-6-metoxy-1,4-benzoquinol methylase
METLREDYDAWHQQVTDYELFRKELQHPWHITVAKLLPDLRGRNVLEIGCGRGNFAIWLASRFPKARVTAIDFSMAAIQIAKSRARDAAVNVSFAVESAEYLSFRDRSFDYVISCECMEHVAEPKRMAKEIFRVLQPGGRFVLTTENYFNGMILMWLQTWILGKPFDSGSGVQPRENFFVFWRVKRILCKSGLHVEWMESNHFQWLFLPRTDPGKLCTEDFANPFFKRLFRPFGRHFAFCGSRPSLGTTTVDS